MFKILLMQATQLPHKMEWMRLTFVHCAPRSTPPPFVVNVMKTILLSVLTHTSCGDKTVYLAQVHVTCVEEVEFTALV